MKTRKLSLAIATLLIASAAFVASCKKSTTTTTDNDTSAASDNSMAESTSNDAVTMAGQASESGSLSYRVGNTESILSTCAVVIYDSTINKTITVNFGSTPCLCHDGHFRSGIIKFDYHTSTNGAKFYRNPGFICLITTQNYMVDGNTVNISKTITNTTPVGFNPATTNMTWTDVSNITIVKANNGGTITWACNRTVTLMNTNPVPFTYAGTTYNVSPSSSPYISQSYFINWAAAIVSVSGTANGTDAKGETYSFTTTSPLVINMNCTPDPNNRPALHPIVQGAFDFTPGTKTTRHVDFGNGSCDLTFTVTISGITYTITVF